MREHPKDIGDRSQLAIILALKHTGYGVLLPIGENTRYDLAIEDAGALYLVQCKTGHLTRRRRDVSHIQQLLPPPASEDACEALPRTDRLLRDHCVETGGGNLLPIDALTPDHYATLRIESPRNNQMQKVRWARDDEIGTVAIGGLRAPSGA